MPTPPEGVSAERVEPTLTPMPLLPPPEERPDLRNMSPRELSDLSYELYLKGVLRWEEYRLVGFPPEMHPKYDQTVGALTEERAQPDRKRDMISEWEAKLDFERRRATDNPDHIARFERVLGVLKWQSMPPVQLQI